MKASIIFTIESIVHGDMWKIEFSDASGLVIPLVGDMIRHEEKEFRVINRIFEYRNDEMVVFVSTKPI